MNIEECKICIVLALWCSMYAFLKRRVSVPIVLLTKNMWICFFIDIHTSWFSFFDLPDLKPHKLLSQPVAGFLFHPLKLQSYLMSASRQDSTMKCWIDFSTNKITKKVVILLIWILILRFKKTTRNDQINQDSENSWNPWIQDLYVFCSNSSTFSSPIICAVKQIYLINF